MDILQFSPFFFLSQLPPPRRPLNRRLRSVFYGLRIHFPSLFMKPSMRCTHEYGNGSATYTLMIAIMRNSRNLKLQSYIRWNSHWTDTCQIYKSITITLYTPLLYLLLNKTYCRALFGKPLTLGVSPIIVCLSAQTHLSNKKHLALFTASWS